MDRALLQANVITKSGKAVETAGDIDTLLLDKTGTITIGNRKATELLSGQWSSSAQGVSSGSASSPRRPMRRPKASPSSNWVREQGFRSEPDLQLVGVHMVKFTAETKCSGVDMPDGTPYPQGRFGSDPCACVPESGATNSRRRYRSASCARISENGGTPLVVCENEQIKGVIELQDIIKTGIRERFERLRKMGVKTVMVTGDNPLTAKYIAEQAGVDDFIAEATPEDKTRIHPAASSGPANWSP